MLFMRGYHFHGGRQRGILGIGIVAVLFFFLLVFLKNPSERRELPSDQSEQHAQALDVVRKEAYELGYTNGYNAAKEDDSAAYQKGYDAAKKEIGSGVWTVSGLLGFVVGLLISVGSYMAMKKKELSLWFASARKRYELKKAFKTIPSNLSPEVDAIAHQIARSYSTILDQLRSGKGYIVEHYSKQWRMKLQELMDKAVRLMELIQDLEAARSNIDAKELAKTVRSLQRVIQNPATDDRNRNVAVKSLQRAKQTKADLLKTEKNLEHCTTSLQGMIGLLESIHLKLSNLNVNTQQTDVLEDLSSELESEMSALEDALQDLDS